MKFAKTLFLGSLPALLFSQPALATGIDAEAELALLLKSSLIEIAQPDIAILVNEQLSKAELEVRTQQMIALANSNLQTAPVKVELGD